jgi:hypothetical protein
MSEPRIGQRVTASDGRVLEFYVDEYKRRWWRAVDDGTLLPYMATETPLERKPKAGGYDADKALSDSWNAY